MKLKTSAFGRHSSPWGRGSSWKSDGWTIPELRIRGRREFLEAKLEMVTWHGTGYVLLMSELFSSHT